MSARSMSMDRMKAIDHYAGTLACWGLGIVATIARRLGGSRSVPAAPKRLLIMKFFGLGHVLMATPLIRAVRLAYPNCHIIFATFESTAPLVTRLGLVDDVLVLRTSGLLAFGMDLARSLFLFVRQPIDIVIDLEFFSKFSTMFGMLTGAPVRVGYYLETFWRDSIITHPVFFNYHRHVLDIYESTVTTLGLEMADRGVTPVPVHAAEEDTANAFLRDHGLGDGEAIIGVNVNASDLSFERRWPSECFVELLDRLLAKRPVRVLLTGSKGEVGYTRAVHKELEHRWPGRVIDACGQLGFGEFAAALARCSVFVTGDSGPMHVAVAAGVPTVSLWGPTNPSFHAPEGLDHTIIYGKTPCSPCLPMLTSRPGLWCDHRADCMQKITTDEVLRAVLNLLDRPRRAL